MPWNLDYTERAAADAIERDLAAKAAAAAPAAPNGLRIWQSVKVGERVGCVQRVDEDQATLGVSFDDCATVETVPAAGVVAL